MGIKTLYDTGASNPIPVEADGAIYSLISSDCVIRRGTSFRIDARTTSRTYSYPVGDIAFIGGAFFEITDTPESFTIPANSTKYIALRITATASGNKGSIVFLNSVEEAKKGELHDVTSSTRQRDLILYKVITNSSGITSWEDLRVIKGTGGITYAGYGQWVGSRTTYNAMAAKPENTICFVYNG